MGSDNSYTHLRSFRMNTLFGLLSFLLPALSTAQLDLQLPILTPTEDLYSDAGIVPDKMDTAPTSPAVVIWDYEVLITQNETVDPADIFNPPTVLFPEMLDLTSLHTIMIVDFGADIMHWMVSNVPGNDVSLGTENIDYLPPFSMLEDDVNQVLIDSGDDGIHATAVLVFRQPGPITVEEDLKGCNMDAIFGRRILVNDLITKYSLEGPIAGNLFWTKYTEGTEEMLCYMTLCTGIPFPFPVPGVNDLPECSQSSSVSPTTATDGSARY